MNERREYAVEQDPRTGPVQVNPPYTLQITESDALPRDAVFSVKFNERFYSVEESPLATGEGSNWNLKAFSMLQQLFQRHIMRSWLPCPTSRSPNDGSQSHQHGGVPLNPILRCYLKLAIEMSRERKLMDVPLTEASDLPFSLSAVPKAFPLSGQLRLWVTEMASQETPFLSADHRPPFPV